MEIINALYVCCIIMKQKIEELKSTKTPQKKKVTFLRLENIKVFLEELQKKNDFFIQKFYLQIYI